MHKGFSLIELLCVLVILSLLTSIAYPNYCHYLTRHNRLDAKTALYDLASKLEVYHMNHQTYQTSVLSLLNSEKSPAGFYQLEISKADTKNYLLKAIPLNTQAMRDDMCQSFTLNSHGIEGIAEGLLGLPKGNAQTCWS